MIVMMLFNNIKKQLSMYFLKIHHLTTENLESCSEFSFINIIAVDAITQS